MASPARLTAFPIPTTPRIATTALAGVGILSAAVYAIGSARIPLSRYFPSAQISVDFVKMLGPGWERPAALYVGFVAVTFALFGVALLVAWRARAIPLTVLFGIPTVCALALLPMYPPTAVDLFHYQAMGRIFWLFHANPLLTPQGSFPYPIGISWADLASPYGPLWSLLVGPASVLPGDHFIVGLLAFKAMGAISLLACAVLIYVLVRRTRPGAEAFAVVLFAWNPFVLMRVVGDGHNDLWMMLFVLIAFERIQRGRWTSSMLMLTLGVLVKFIPLLLGPPFLLYIWHHAGGSRRDRTIQIAKSLALCAVLAAFVYAPFWAGVSTFDSVRKESAHMITSTPVLLQLLTSRWFPEPTATQLASRIPLVAFALMYIPAAWHARRDLNRLIAMSFAILFLYLVIAAAWFRPWYMLWPLSLAALRPRGWLGATALTISLAAAFPDLVEQFRNYWPLIAEYDRAVAAPIVLAFLPPLLVWLWGVGVTDSFALQRPTLQPATEGRTMHGSTTPAASPRIPQGPAHDD